MSLHRTPPSDNNNNPKRVRSDEDVDEVAQPLTLEAVMRAMNQHFAQTRARIEEINVNISGKIDTVRAELDGKLESVLHDINTFKADCTTRLRSNEDALCTLTERVNEISHDIGGLEKRNELIVSGIPYLKDENLTAYFSDMWKYVGLHVNSTPSVDVRRLRPTNQNDGLIVVQFALQNNRDDFYSSYLRKRDLKLCHLGIDSPRRIYVNENLTVAARKLKASALRLKKAGKISSVYTKQGTVMVRRSADQLPVPVRSDEMLDQFLS